MPTPSQKNDTSVTDLDTIIQAMQQGDSIRIVCYGNSITNGFKVGSYQRVAHPYPESLEKLLQKQYQNPHIQVINEGHNGWRSDQAQTQLKQLVIQKKPDLVTIMFGINDAYSNFSTDYYEKKIVQMIQQLREEKITVLLLTPTPIITPFNNQVHTYVELLKEIAKEQEVAFFNVYEAVSRRREKEKVAWENLLPDEVHFADDKYKWIAEEIYEFITHP